MIEKCKASKKIFLKKTQGTFKKTHFLQKYISKCVCVCVCAAACACCLRVCACVVVGVCVGVCVSVRVCVDVDDVCVCVGVWAYGRGWRVCVLRVLCVLCFFFHF